MKHFGFDLDNTLIDFSQACKYFSQLNELPEADNVNDLKSVLKPNDEESSTWTECQSWLYGKGMQYANVSSGALNLLQMLVESKFKVSIISHKTEFGPLQFGAVPFRSYSLDWIQKSQLSQYFTVNNIFFAENLDMKIKFINELNLDYYVDDLIKIFTHNRYRRDIKSFLYKSNEECPSWLIEIDNLIEIYDHVF